MRFQCYTRTKLDSNKPNLEKLLKSFRKGILQNLKDTLQKMRLKNLQRFKKKSLKKLISLTYFYYYYFPLHISIKDTQWRCKGHSSQRYPIQNISVKLKETSLNNLNKLHIWKYYLNYVIRKQNWQQLLNHVRSSSSTDTKTSSNVTFTHMLWPPPWRRNRESKSGLKINIKGCCS